MKILVTGDSFATYSGENSHWASIWADNHNFTTTNVSFPGQNYIKITEKLLNRNLSDYDCVIFLLTDFIRVSITDIKEDIRSIENTNWMVDFLLGYYSNKAFLNSIICNSNDDYADWKVGKYSRRDICVTKHAIDVFFDLNNVRKPSNERDKIELEKAGMLYSTISLRWLIKANWLALSNFAKELRYNHNIPLICVAPPTRDWIHWRANHLPKESTFWNSSREFIMVNDIGDNHLSLQDANKLAELFENFCQQTNLIKTVFNK